MRLLNVIPVSQSVRTGRIICWLDLEPDRGVVCNGLVVIEDPSGGRTVISRRVDGAPTVELSPEVQQEVLARLDLALRDRVLRVA